MPVSEQDTLITKNGRPTQRAYDRLTYALIAKAYQDDELTQLATESTGEEARNVFKALVAVAPKYVRLLDSEYDLRDVIAGVAHLAIDAQRKGVSLESHIGLSGDLDLGDAPVGRANVADPSTIKVAQEVAKVTRSYKSIQSLFSTIADEAFEKMLQADSAEADMFGGVQTRTREQVVDGAIASYRSANASDQLFQLIGESGARDLDQSEERWIRIRNLSTAKSMAMMGKDAKSIRLATGWERGADGLWRYEIMDGNWKGTMPTEGVFKLSDIYDAPELYKAYWFLRDLKVEFVEGLEESEGIQGSYNESEGVIRIDTTQLLAERAARNLLAEKKAEYDKLKARIDEGFTKEELEYYELVEIRPFEELAQLEQQIKRYENLILSERLETSQYRLGVLVHEIQHAIQYREGFETGGSPLMFPAREDLIDDIRWAKDNLARANKALEVQADLDLSDESEYESKTFAEHKHDKIVAEAQIKSLNESLEKWVDPDEAYNKLAGEVESRNVMKRLSLTAERRRELLLEETEDVLRKDQILKNGVREYYQSASYRPDDVPKTNVEIIGLTKAPFKNVDAAIAWAEENGIVGVMTNEETGGKGEISISKASVREMLNDRQRRKSASIDVHFAALQKIREVIRTSVIVESHPDYRKGSDGKRSPEYGVNDEVFIDIAYGCVKLDGIIYRVKTTLKRYKDPKTSDKAYAYEVSELEVLAGNLVNAVTDTNHTSNTSVPVSILLKGVKTVNGLDVLELYQRAWHGTPHIFDQFTLDHIGSGEGVQAHGWGLYFALTRAVAEKYRERLTRKAGDQLAYDGKEKSELPQDVANVLGALESFGLNPFKDIQSEIEAFVYHKKERVRTSLGIAKVYEDLIRTIESNPKMSISAFQKIVPEGEKYRISFAIDAAKNAAKQAGKRTSIEDVKRQLEFSRDRHYENAKPHQDLVDTIDRLDVEKIDYKREGLGRLFKVEIPDEDVMLDEQKLFSEQPEFIQDKLRDVFSATYSNAKIQELTGRQIYVALTHAFGSPENASRWLNDNGIKGITYDGRLDGRCYVVFDDKAIKVVEFLQDQKEQAEARGAYNPADRTISLFRKADMSTFLHESAHAFLDIMIDLADMENAPADLKADVQTLMKWFGLKDAAEWKGLSFAQKTDYHEKFARGFESYLREGKAHSTALGRAFSRFKKWLVTLYKSAKELNVDVTPQVKEVMDRMLASEAEITQAQSINRLVSIP